MDHNMQGIFLHVLADTLGSVGVVVSTLLIKYKGWLFTDPACSIFISALIIASVVPLVRNSSEILLQRVPRAVEVHLKQSMKEVEAVEGIQHCQNLHIWSFTNTEIVGSLHLHVVAGTDKQQVCNKVAQILKKAGIKDLTLQIENVQSLVK
jgi:zinc transporter 5/7